MGILGERVLTTIENEFKQWLMGIQEDDPLPYEISYVYFLVDFLNNDIAVSYTGSDRPLIIFDFAMYCPLEAEYFFCSELRQIAQSRLNKQSKKQFLEQLTASILKVVKSLPFLKNKKVFVGERFEKVV